MKKGLSSNAYMSYIQTPVNYSANKVFIPDNHRTLIQLIYNIYLWASKWILLGFISVKWSICCFMWIVFDLFNYIRKQIYLCAWKCAHGCSGYWTSDFHLPWLRTNFPTTSGCVIATDWAKEELSKRIVWMGGYLSCINTITAYL